MDITIAVKSEPILNDACMEDAINTGLDEFGEIVEIGAGTVGYVDSEISDEFREIFIERVRDCQPPQPYLESM